LAVDPSITYAGIELRNPLVVAPAGISGTVRRMKKAEARGCGAIVVKTLFEDEVTRSSPTPRFRAIRSRAGSPDSFVLYSYEQASPFKPERYAREIERAKSEIGIPIIASVGCASNEAWMGYARLVEEAGADAVELNISCPHARPMLSEEDVSSAMCDITKLVKESTSIPAIPKMTPQATSPLAVALALQNAGADALVMFNRFTGLDIDLGGERPVMHGGFAGHGGPWSIHYVLRWLVTVCRAIRIPIAASGGIWSGEDMAKAILAGATATEMCSAIVVDGYGRISQALAELEAFMVGKGYATIDEFRGNASGRILSTDQIDRRRRVLAAIDDGMCTSCGLCQRVCIYDAVEESSGVYRITKGCQGCGLCAELCPVGAIAMGPIPADGH
jgi:dihydroorotate dehydrogenase (fumarate)